MGRFRAVQERKKAGARSVLIMKMIFLEKFIDNDGVCVRVRL
jgi:hypothetical protein